MATTYVSQTTTSGISEYTYETRLNEILYDFPDYVFDFFNHMAAANRRPKTIIAYATDIKIFFNFIISANPSIKEYKDITPKILEQFRSQDADEYVKYLRSYETGKITKDGRLLVNQNNEQARRRKLSSLRSFYDYLVLVNHIKDNPLKNYHPDKLKRNKKDALNSEEVVNILEGMRTQATLSDTQKIYAERTYYRDIAIMTTFLYTGIRVSELVNLDISDIIDSDLKLRVERKGGKIDYVLLNNDTYEALQDYINIERYDEPGEQAIFLSSRRGENSRLSVKSAERIVKKYCKGMTEKNVTPHTLRRTFGTTLYNETGDVYLVQEALGHEDVSTTATYYTTLREERAQQIRNMSYNRKETKS